MNSGPTQAETTAPAASAAEDWSKKTRPCGSRVNESTEGSHVKGKIAIQETAGLAFVELR